MLQTFVACLALICAQLRVTDWGPSRRVMDYQLAVGGFPTVLLLEIDAEWPARISSTLRGQGYNILEAEGMPDALSIAKTHSRPIQLLLSGLRCDDVFMDRIQQLRPGMHLIQFTRDEMFREPNSIPERVQ